MERVRKTAAYGLLQATVWGIYAILIAFAINFLEELGISGTAVSVILGAATVGSVVVQLLLTEAVSRSGRIPVQAVVAACGAVMMLGCVMMLVLPSPWSIVGLVVSSVVLQTLPGLINSVGMEAISRGVPISFGISRAGGSLCYSLLSTAAGYLVKGRVPTMMPILTMVVSGALGLSALLVWKSCGPTLGGAKKTQKKSGSFLRENKRFAVVLVGSVLLALSHMLIANFLYYIIVAVQGNESDQGLAAAVCGLSELPTLFLFGWMTRKLACRWWVKLCGLFFVAKAAALLVATSVEWVIGAQLFQMIGYGVWIIGSVEYAAEAVPGDPIRAQSYLGASSTVATVIAMSTGGIICDRLGVDALLWTSLAVGTAGTLIMFAAARSPAVELNTNK